MELDLWEPAPAQHMEQKHGKTESPGKTGDVENLQGVWLCLESGNGEGSYY